jgi:ribosomal protein L7/L12
LRYRIAWYIKIGFKLKKILLKSALVEAERDKTSRKDIVIRDGRFLKIADAAAPADAAPAEPQNVTVMLTSVGDAKVGVIKVVRTITGLGLVDAKKLVDALPAEIKKDVPVEEADNIKKQLMDAGATVEYK